MSDKSKIQYKLFIRYLGSFKKLLCILIMCTLSSVTLQTFTPKVLQRFINATIEGQASQLIIWLIATFFICSLLQQVFLVLLEFFCTKLAWGATNKLRSDLLSHFLDFDLLSHQRYSSGEMIERLDSDINNLFAFFTTLVIDFIGNGLFIFAILAVLIRESWISSGVVALYVVIALVILLVAQRLTRNWQMDKAKAQAEFSNTISEQVNNLQVIRYSGAQSFSFQIFSEAVSKLYKKTVRGVMVYPILWSSSTIIFALGLVCAMGIGLILWNWGAISIGTVFLIYYYIDQMVSPLLRVRDRLHSLQLGQVSMLRIQEIFIIKRSVSYGNDELYDNQSSIANGLSLQVEHLSYSYQKSEPVLRGISFTLGANCSLGIIGRTGSGKTTLVNLICRLLEIQEGNIRLNNQPLLKLSEQTLQNHLVYLGQNCRIFHGTIRDNITLYDGTVSDADIYAALDALELRGWINGMPNGLDTVLESAGESISAGEAQLLAIIRAMTKNVSLFVLDEATAQLDPIMQNSLSMAIRKMILGRTAIIIAHNLTTLEFVDNILILEEGKIAEFGEREKLLSSEASEFTRLLAMG